MGPQLGRANRLIVSSQFTTRTRTLSCIAKTCCRPVKFVGERHESVVKAVGNAPAVSTGLSTRPCRGSCRSVGIVHKSIGQRPP